MPNASEQPQESRQGIHELVPPSWLAEPKVKRVLLSCHRSFRVTKAPFISGPRILDVMGVRIILLYGKVSYMDSSAVSLDFTQDGNLQLVASGVRQTQTPEGPYTLFLIPVDAPDQLDYEERARRKLTLAAGLLAAFQGRNIIYDKLFDNLLDIETGQTHWFSPVRENPFWFPALELEDEKLNRITNASQSMAVLETEDRNRLELSLRWFHAALFEGGVDAFLKYWIAMETLAMPNTSNVRPANETLGRIYNISYQEACNRFLLGRIFDLRSRIVHDGLQPPIDPRLESYLAAIYLDILHDRLGVRSEFRAGHEMAEPNFNLRAYLGTSS